MATKKTSGKKTAAKKSTAKKTNNSRSMAAKGYVKAPKETKVEVVEAKKQEEVKENVKALVREEEKPVKKETKKSKKFDIKKCLTKKNICIVVSSVLVLVIIILIIACCNNQEKKLTKYMKQLGKVYYEDIYHASFQNDAAREETLSKFAVTGINTDLENLVRAVSTKKDLPTDAEILAKFVNKKTGKACNQSSTRIYFYPSEPYGAKDYKIEVKLDCGFNEK